MKKTVAVVAVVALLSIAAVASAHMWGWGGGPGYGGHMRGGYGPGCEGPGYGPGQGYGCGPGYGGHMRGWGPGALSEEDQKLFNETADLRRDLHEKKFDFREAWRAGDKEKAEAIEKEIEALQEKLSAKLGPEFGGKYGRGYGRGFGPGQCTGPYGR